MALANELSMTDKLAYFQKLRGMSVPEAVAYVRAELATLARNSAHGAAGPGTDEETEPGLAMSDAEIDAHVGAIRGAMTPEESETVRVMFEELVFEHRLLWVEKLCRMSVPEGVAFLRGKLAEARARRPGARRGRAADRARAERRAGRGAGATPASARPPGARARRSSRAATVGASPDRLRRRSRPRRRPRRRTGGAPTAGLGMVSPATQAHIAAIQSALTRRGGHAVAGLPRRAAAGRAVRLDRHLLMLPVPEAVAMIRAQLAADRAGAAQPDDATASTDALGAAAIGCGDRAAQPRGADRGADARERRGAAPTMPANAEAAAPTMPASAGVAASDKELSAPATSARRELAVPAATLVATADQARPTRRRRSAPRTPTRTCWRSRMP